MPHGNVSAWILHDPLTDAKERRYTAPKSGIAVQLRKEVDRAKRPAAATVIRFESVNRNTHDPHEARRYTHAAVFINSRWCLTGAHNFFGAHSCTHDEFIARVLARDDVENIAVAIDFERGSGIRTAATAMRADSASTLRDSLSDRRPARMGDPKQWMPLIALLANPETREVAAKIMLDESLESAMASLSPSKRRRVTEAVLRSGLVDAETKTFAPDVFRRILDSRARPKQEGNSRYLDGKRIRQYPASLEVRGELLAWVARDVFAPGEVLTEREVNARLLPYSEDVAVLRRYLVDYQLIERRRDGSEYALTGSAPTLPA